MASVHGSVHGAGWVGGGVVYFVLGLPDLNDIGKVYCIK